MKCLRLAAQGLVAGSLAHFHVAATINKVLGARELDYGTMVAAMVLQLTNLPHQGLHDLDEFHYTSPLKLLLGQELDPNALTCAAVADCLDQIAQVGPETVWAQVAQQVVTGLGLTIKELRLEHRTWEVEYDSPDLGYLWPVERSAPHTWDLVRLVDPKTGLPVPSAQDSHYVSCESADLVLRGERHAVMLRGERHAVMRLPKSSGLSQQCLRYAQQHPDEGAPMKVGRATYQVLWAPEGELYGTPVKLLVVRSQQDELVLATTDRERPWTARALWALYHQGRGKNKWRMARHNTFAISSCYLEPPERAAALLCVVEIAQLMAQATELILNERCRALAIPNPDGTPRTAARLTFERVYQIFAHHCITIVIMDDGTARLVGCDALPQSLATALGAEWAQLYDEALIQRVYAP